MSIRAKFKVISVTAFEGGAEQVEAQAANGRAGSANAQWAMMTPSGTLKMYINNPAAQGKLVPGRFYFLDITETEEDAG